MSLPGKTGSFSKMGFPFWPNSLSITAGDRIFGRGFLGLLFECCALFMILYVKRKPALSSYVKTLINASLANTTQTPASPVPSFPRRKLTWLSLCLKVLGEKTLAAALEGGKEARKSVPLLSPLQFVLNLK